MFRIRMVVAALTLLVCDVSPAAAQSVRGHIKFDFFGAISPDEVTVNAWIDEDGMPQGMMEWNGGLVEKAPKGGPTDPWHMDVLDLEVDGNTAHVFGIVTHSVIPEEIGTLVDLYFTDNSGMGEPDEFQFEPILAGNVTVSD
jgi:hypothetical protein